MYTSEEKHLLFYQKLGELFYSIAASDKVVRKSEYDSLKQLVKTEWTTIDDYKDAFKTDAVYQMEIVFEWFNYEQMDADQCFQDFSEYYKENASQFTPERKRLIWKTANKIAAAFSGKNKSEVIMLSRLRLLMQ
ncbi:MAG: hypothetical protein HKN48_10940 [Flavobacteriaceae bacterium]|nr:hypothetical protein [Flavobacteriaceae bacterium]